MSKTQDKKAQRLAEAGEFVKTRRQLQLEMFENNFAVGLQMFEDNKEKLLPEEILLIEKEIENNREAIEQYKAKFL